MNQRIKEIIRLPLVRNTLKLSSSSALLMLLPLVVTPILSRLYTPEDYGDWGVFSSVLYIVSSFLFLSYENTIIKSKDNVEVPNLLLLCMVTSSLVILGVSFCFIVGALWDIPFFKDFPSLSLLVILLVATAVHTLCNNIANRQNKYGIMSVAAIINGFSQASFRILFGIFPVISYGLIVGNVLAQIVATIFIFYYLRKIFDPSFWLKISLPEVKKLAVRYKKFPLFDAPARLIELSISNLALIILTCFWSKEDVGCYSMIMMFILLPISVVGSSMANVYYREISENVDNIGKLSQITLRASKICFSIALLPLLFLALGGDKLLVLFLGEQWQVAGKMSLCLAVFSVPLILSEPLLPLFRCLDKQEMRFSLNSFCFFLSLGSLIIVSLINRNIYISLLTFSSMYAFVRYLMYFRVLKLADISYKEVNKFFLYIVIGAYLLLGVRLFLEI